MTKIILGSLLMVILVGTLTGIVLAKEELRGCPRCGSDSNLRVLRYDLSGIGCGQADTDFGLAGLAEPTESTLLGRAAPADAA
jgi:hypothetical protein